MNYKKMLSGAEEIIVGTEEVIIEIYKVSDITENYNKWNALFQLTK